MGERHSEGGHILECGAGGCAQHWPVGGGGAVLLLLPPGRGAGGHRAGVGGQEGEAAQPGGARAGGNVRPKLETSGH